MQGRLPCIPLAFWNGPKREGEGQLTGYGAMQNLAPHPFSVCNLGKITRMCSSDWRKKQTFQQLAADCVCREPMLGLYWTILRSIKMLMQP